MSRDLIIWELIIHTCVKNVSLVPVQSVRTCPANFGVRSCPIRKLICPVRFSPTGFKVLEIYNFEHHVKHHVNQTEAIYFCSIVFKPGEKSTCNILFACVSDQQKSKNWDVQNEVVLYFTVPIWSILLSYPKESISKK